MSQNSAERLKTYLAQLPPKAQALLMREFERALERGDDAAVATFVLAELRKVVRAEGEGAAPRFSDPQRLVFRPLEPFLTDTQDQEQIGIGQIRRHSLPTIWGWLSREGAPEAVGTFMTALKSGDDPGMAVQTMQRSASLSITTLLAEPDQRRAAARIGPASAIEDLPGIAIILQNGDVLDFLAAKLPGQFRAFDEAQVSSVATVLTAPMAQRPQLIPFALQLIKQRLPASWQIVRLAIHAAATDDATRVAINPFGIAVPMAISKLSRTAAQLRNDIKRGQFKNAANYVKVVHDGVRGLRTELDIRQDSAWGKSLAMLRVDVSSTLKNVIDNVPGRVRRLLRQRADKDVAATTRLEAADIDETAALIEFVAMCRSYASELAINEVTLRTYSELQASVEKSTQMLVESLRNCAPAVRGFREQQTRAAIRFCDALFGHDYAVQMGRAADNALADERKAARSV